MREPVLDRTHALARGPRVRLRLARLADRERVAALLAQRSVDADDLDVRRLLAFDPALRHVLAAFAPIDGAETLVGVLRERARARHAA